ncbi:MAG: ABC transporter ATP-binding protein [Candidatus Omnitrophica bacterium]|nr:ABC transporter ATP-binding protein [Candidatus Omnitrophota bacterium]
MNHLLDVENISVAYVSNGKQQTVLEDVSLYIAEGESVGIIGESGSGKTTLSDTILNSISFKNGTVLGGNISYRGHDLLSNTKPIGRQITYIPQDPASSLDPLFPIRTNFKEIIKTHMRDSSYKKIDNVINDALTKVHLSSEALNIHSYPHQLSGGMQQRILIALALLSNPELIIADEPTSNLDVTTEREIIRLFEEIRTGHGASFLLTTHNLSLAKCFCDRLYVFFMGNVVEMAQTDELFSNPQHPYTKALIDAMPSITEKKSLKAYAYSACIYDRKPSGCRFITRCREKNDRCVIKPEERKISENHYVYCWNEMV